MANQQQTQNDADLGGDYARDTHRGGFGDDYARDSDPNLKDETRRTKDAPSEDIGKASE